MTEECFHLKGNILTSIVIELNHYDPSSFVALLQEKIAKAPSFFSQSPVIMDVRGILDNLDPHKLKEMVTLCFDSGLQPIGFKGVSDPDMLSETGLAILSDDIVRDNPQSVSPQEKTESVESNQANDSANAATLPPPSMRPTKFIDQPVRSGQQIYAQNANLVILSNINKGAEVLADGDIHVYGALRGRALAGVKGDMNARIFCQHLEAELVSVAGIFQLSDNIPQKHQKQSVQILLQDENLIVKSL
ncbi:MAG: septum site-determining protein MinC [Cellvibrionales bacterium]|nr:septum site-determining protein MinC [Cellvibrionales bacterium]